MAKTSSGAVLSRVRRAMVDPDPPKPAPYDMDQEARWQLFRRFRHGSTSVVRGNRKKGRRPAQTR